MRVRSSVVLLLLVFLVVVVAGCGSQSGNESQGNGGNESGKKERTKKGATTPELTFVSGTLGRVDVEKGRLTMRPEEGEGPLRFKFNPESLRVTVDGKEAQPQDLEGRQKAEVGYFMRKDRMVARVVLSRTDGNPQGGNTGG